MKNEYYSEDVPELDTDCEIVVPNYTWLATAQSTYAHITDDMYLMKRASISLKDK